jgi:hypothetical protein
MNDDFDNAVADRAALRAALAALPPARVYHPCRTCNLPGKLREIIEEDRAGAAPHSFDQLARFLATQGVTLSGAAIQAHFRKGHAK